VRSLEEKIAALGPWYHAVDLGDGVVTPGKVDPRPRAQLALAELPADLSGSTVLDIGGNCGGVAIEFARRGAKTTVLEIKEEFVAQGEFLADVLDLAVKFRRGVVYDLPSLGQFDYVVFYGLIYHLRHPLLALDMVRAATRRRMFLSARLCESDDLVWEMSNVAGNVAEADKEHWFNWWLPSASAMEESMRVYGFTDIRTLDIDERRIEGFWSATPNPAVPPLHDHAGTGRRTWWKRGDNGARSVQG
jgi:tRNA (mo5U34)-methyltransferase